MSKITFNAVEAAYIYSWYLKRPVFNSQEENETKLENWLYDFYCCNATCDSYDGT